MKRSNLYDRLTTACGWCGKAIRKGAPVFGSGGKFRAGVDLSPKAGQVIEVHLAGAKKTVLVAISSGDSQAKREGKDFVFMTCSAECGKQLKLAFEQDINVTNSGDPK